MVTIQIISNIKEQGMNEMKIFRRFLALFTAVMMLLSLAACGGKGDGETTTAEPESTTSYIRDVKTKIASLSGPLGIGISKLGADRDYAYDVKSYADSQQAAELIKNGEADIAVLPVNLAASLYNETNGAIKILAVNTLGVFHILENGSEIKSIADLKGKTVYSLGEGSVPEFLLNYILAENNLDGEVTVEYKADYSEIKALADEGKADIVMLPEPYAAMLASAADGVRYALDLADEWGKVSETPFAQGVIVARTEYIEQNPEYIETFLMQNEVSVNYLVENPQAGATLLSETGYFDSPELAQAALAGCNPSFIKGENMKAAVKAVIDMLYQADPASIGGAVPDDGICYTV